MSISAGTARVGGSAQHVVYQIYQVADSGDGLLPRGGDWATLTASFFVRRPLAKKR